MKDHRIQVLLFSFLLAFCSLFYELVFAQVLSVCIGGTKTQYLITISLFTFALGMGSLSFNRLTKNIEIKKIFFYVEFLLIILGSLGPFFIAWLLQAKHEFSLFLNLKIYFSYFIIFLIGFLSGFELPCLFSMMDKAHGKVLAFDYLGMLLASILFPFLFLPHLGTAASTLFIANMNGIALIWLRKVKSRKLNLVLGGINISIFAIIIIYRFERLRGISFKI